MSALILLVDDEPLIRRSVGRILRGRGYTVVEAGDAQEALQIDEHASKPPALLLTDVVMPRMSGVALAAQMEARHPGLPVVFISGFTPEGELQARLTHPGAAFLPKPFDTAELVATIEVAITGA